MAVGQAVEFSVAPLGAASHPWDDSAELKLRLESKALDGTWQRVSEEPVTLRGVNVVTRLDRAQHAYRLSLWPSSCTTEWTVAFPFYLSVPALPPSPSDDTALEMCPPNVGTFALAPTNEQILTSPDTQVQTTFQGQEVADSRATQAAAVLGGTLAAAMLLYSLLPYMKVVRRRRQRTRSHPQTAKEKENWCKEKGGPASTPSSPAGAGRRFSGSLDYGIEPAGAYRDGLREKRSRAPSDNGSELLLATLPDFNDERGWRDFFDSQIYHNEPEKEQEARKGAKSSLVIQRGRTLRQDQAKIAKLRHARITTTAAREDKFLSIKERIDRAATEAAIDDAQTFFEFWQT